MAEAEYSVVCYGEILDGFDRDQVISNLVELFKQPAEKVAQILERSRVTLKSGLDELRANHYRQALEKAGLKVVVEGAEPAAVPASVAATPTGAQAAAVPQPKAADAAAPPGEAVAASAEGDAERRPVNFVFNGQGGEYFRIWIVNLFLTILTLGIYSPWAKVRNKKYFYGSTALDGSTFDYTANPVAILKGRIIAGVFFVAYSVVNQLFPLMGLALLVPLLLAVPWMICRSLLFNARYSIYRNVPFHFSASYKDAFFVYILWPFAGILTLGGLIPYAFYKQQRFLAENHGYGTTNFEFSAGPKDYYKMYGVVALIIVVGAAIGALLGAVGGAVILAILFYPTILAAYFILFAYVSVKTFNLRFNNSTIADHGFEAKMKVGSYARLVAVNTLATSLTLGLFRPWAMVRTARYKANHLNLQAKDDLGDFAAHEKERVGAFGEQMGEMFDVDVGI